MIGRPCPHGDPSCPCNNDDLVCNYAEGAMPDGTVSPASPCPRTGHAPCATCIEREEPSWSPTT